MKVFATACLVCALGLAFGQTLGTWPGALAKRSALHTSARQQKKHAAPNAKVQSGKTSFVAGDHQPETDEQKAARQAFHDDRMNALRLARIDLKQGHAEKAAARLQARLDAYPWDSTITPDLADAYFRLDKSSLAYQALAPYATIDADPQLLLRASLAAAKKREVYDGQKQYCLKVIGSYTDPQTTALAFSGGETPAAVELASWVAIGVDANSSHNPDTAAFYFKQALKKDPSNPIANLLLGEIYQAHGEYANAVACFQKALPRAVGKTRDCIQIDLRTASYAAKQKAKKGG